MAAAIFSALRGYVDSALVASLATGLLYLMGYVYFESYYAYWGVPTGEIVLPPATYLVHGFLLALVLMLLALGTWVNRDRAARGELKGAARWLWAGDRMLVLLAVSLVAYYATFVALLYAMNGAWSLTPRDSVPILLGVAFLGFLLVIRKRRQRFSDNLRARDPATVAYASAFALAALFSV
ncbi:MAG TPA: hypothetical protein VNX21_07170, partial [Candidatus Thermoplasmatota archaeon]|nr:hypothetical protein [Candidatus Thermoplasmatota archaeon]